MVSVDLLRARREDENMQRQLHKALAGVTKNTGGIGQRNNISYNSSKHAQHLRRVKHRGHAALKPSAPKSDVVRWSDMYGIFGNVPGVGSAAGKLSDDNVVVYPNQKKPTIVTPFARWARSIMHGEYPATQEFYDRITHVQDHS